ncbi:MAG TPA: hypothetical protein VF783_13810 [Terriglobales bacterium]
MSEVLRTDWIECNLDSVLRYFAADFKFDDREIWAKEWFVDVAKGKVIFRIDSRRKEGE